MSRVHDIGRAYLLWLRHHEDLPEWEDFLASSLATVNGETVGDDELHDTVRWLDGHGLIDGIHIDQLDVPARVRLTPAGRICVIDYDGNVLHWSQPSMSHVDNSVHVTSHNAQVTAHSQHVMQTQTVDLVDVEKLRVAAGAALEASVLFAVSDDQRSAIEQTAREIIAEADSATPDHKRLQVLGGKLKEWLPPAASATNVITMIVNGIQHALH